MLLRIHIFTKQLFGGLLIEVDLQKWLCFGVSDFKAIHYADFVLWNSLWLQDHKAASEVICYFHEATVILKHTAIVGCAKDGHQLSAGKEFVALVYNQVASAYQVNIILVTELFYNLLIKGKADSSFVFFPLDICCFRVRP